MSGWLLLKLFLLASVSALCLSSLGFESLNEDDEKLKKVKVE